MRPLRILFEGDNRYRAGCLLPSVLFTGTKYPLTAEISHQQSSYTATCTTHVTLTIISSLSQMCKLSRIFWIFLHLITTLIITRRVSLSHHNTAVHLAPDIMTTQDMTHYGMLLGCRFDRSFRTFLGLL